MEAKNAIIAVLCFVIAMLLIFLIPPMITGNYIYTSTGTRGSAMYSTGQLNYVESIPEQDVRYDSKRNDLYVDGVKCPTEAKYGTASCEKPCSAGDFRCNGVVQEYCQGGLWVTTQRCANGCFEGECKRPVDCTEEDFSCYPSYGAMYLRKCVAGTWKDVKRCKGECSNGVCKDMLADRTCTDTDSGMTYEKKGFIAGTDEHGESFSFADKCASSDELLEYGCFGKVKASNRIACENGCFDGACMPKEKAEEVSQVEPMRESPQVVSQPPKKLSWWNKLMLIRFSFNLGN